MKGIVSPVHFLSAFYKTLHFCFVVLMSVLMLAGCDGSTSAPVTLTAVTVSPSGTSIATGSNVQFRATGFFSNGSIQDLTASVAWSSSDAGIVSIGNSEGSKGAATAVAAGSATITAVSGTVSASTTVTSSPLVSIAVTPADSTGIVGTTQQFRASGRLLNDATQDLTGQTVWSSSNAQIATIGADGNATAGAAAGESIISASFAGISGSTKLTTATVTSIAVTPANPAIVVGATQQFAATGTLSNNTTRDVTQLVTWESSNTGIAAINAGGTASSLSGGSTVITATLGVSGTATLTVKSLVSIAVTPASPTIDVGSTLQFTATGTFSDNSTQDITASVTWGSANTGVATISNASGSKGVATATALGSTTITATSGGLSRSVTLAVNRSNRAYVTNSGGTTLSVIDTTGNVVVDTIDVGTGPQGVAVNAAANRAYVTIGSSNSLSVIDTSSHSVIASVVVGGGPRGVAFDPSTNRAYVANSNNSTISVIDTAVNTLIATIAVGSGPVDVALNPAAGRAYVANGSSNNIYVVDTTNNAVVAIVPVGSGPQRVALHPAANRAYVTNSGINTLSVIDTVSNTVIAAVPVAGGPRGVAINPAANRVYTANSGSNSVSVIDTTSNAVVSTIPVGTTPQGIALNPATNRLYVTNSGNGTLSVIDTGNNRVVATVTVGAGPGDVAVIP